ncbi:hypothetical protein CYY_007745 [Polysphondylium violaceum]|uniref:Copper transport protein n=1 Tax=Polysphondylium violaceum TaxID=133409 RepID=A0A8J4PRG2_9MYCE|nr:hypothetical protein CYY_007745 [Polysphondylium violaceum]
MSFHWSYFGQPILFKTWVTNSAGAYVLSLLIVFAVSLFSEYWSSYRYSLNSDKNTSSANYEELTPLNGERRGHSIGKLYRTFMKSHLWKTICHMLGFMISYFIMLVVMTFNAGLGIACVLGVGLGYYLFGRSRLGVVEDICH